MAIVEMIMPKMGESIMEATIISWLKKEGDVIEQDESVLEVATDKVDTEVPAIQAGILSKVLAKEGEVVPVGSAIAEITVSEEGVIPTNGMEKSITDNSDKPKEEFAVPVIVDQVSNTTKLTKPAEGRFYSPLVLNIAQKEQVPMAELELLPGTGKEGRVTKKDILAYVKSRSPGRQPDVELPTPVISNTPEPASVITVKDELKSIPQQVVSGEDEIIEMDRMRKMIAERMVESKRISAHVTSFVEADVTKIVRWRNKVKDGFQKVEGEKLTFTPIFIEAIIRAIKDFPMINVSVGEGNIIRHKQINIGMAVALPSGNLIVPVVHKADQFNLSGLAKKVNELADKARAGKLIPDELAGGTFSFSNVGSFGNVMGTPIIVQPQVGILALGAIVKKPAVVESEEGDMIAIRHKMFLSHSYDHRVVDGALGGMFVRRVADYLEAFDINRTV